MGKRGEEPIHYADCMTYAAIWTSCGQGMQVGGDKWHPDVNQWGEIGITKTEGWKLITTDKSLVTCLECRRRLNRKKRRRQCEQTCFPSA